MVKKSAIILGGTGLTGSLVLDHLLANDNYDCIKLFSRKTCGIKHPKLEEYIVDVLNLEVVKSDFIADEVYCCIGTTKKKTPDQEMYNSIDFGIPVEAAKLCVENKIPVLSVISAIGADPKSKIFYNRTKGTMEQAVMQAGVNRTYILRPSLITGDRMEKRFGEKLSIALFRFMQPLFVGKWKKYKTVNADSIAKRMIELANSDEPSKIVESNEI